MPSPMETRRQTSPSKFIKRGNGIETKPIYQLRIPAKEEGDPEEGKTDRRIRRCCERLKWVFLCRSSCRCSSLGFRK